MASFLLSQPTNKVLRRKPPESQKSKLQKSNLDVWVLQAQNQAHRLLTVVQMCFGLSVIASVLDTDHLLFYEYYNSCLIPFPSHCHLISILHKRDKQSHRTRKKIIIKGLKNIICIKIVSGNFSQVYQYGVVADKLTVLSLKNIGIFSNISEKVYLHAQFQNKNTVYTKVRYS